MKLNIINLENKEIGKKELPEQFSEEVRPDLIKRAVHAIQSHKRQKYGASPDAGKRASAYLSKRRKKYRGTYGIGQSRTPRKIMSRRGRRMFYVGAFAPQTVGGRRAHPPKPEKEWSKKINKKERRKAIRSAMTAVMIKEIVKGRNHFVPENYPFIVDDKIEKINKTKEAKEALEKLGFGKELERSSVKKIRAGKGKARGRKYRKKKGLLIVTSKECNLTKTAKNIAGIDIEQVKNINAELLAPGAEPGRITLFTKSAIEKIEKEGLFI